MMRLTFLLGTDAGTPSRTRRPAATPGTSHRLAHALADGFLHVRGMSLRRRMDAAEALDEIGPHVLVFAAIVTDAPTSTDDIVFAAALLGADGTMVEGQRRSGTWTQPPRRLMRLIIEFCVDGAFTPAQLVLVAIGATEEATFRLAIRVNGDEDRSYS